MNPLPALLQRRYSSFIADDCLGKAGSPLRSKKEPRADI